MNKATQRLLNSGSDPDLVKKVLEMRGRGGIFASPTPKKGWHEKKEATVLYNRLKRVNP